jgi:hypothetical protein
MYTIDPKQFDLSPRVLLKKIGKTGIAIVINRKSRIIMKDGNNILEKAMKIKSRKPGMKVSLETTAPVCSKTSAFLKKNDIEVVQI